MNTVEKFKVESSQLDEAKGKVRRRLGALIQTNRRLIKLVEGGEGFKGKEVVTSGGKISTF
jgi:hypothetical protein